MAEQREAATDFYDALAPMFDVMTNWEERLASEGPFLRGLLAESGAQRVLDAACGSGGHAVALASWGYHAAGADVSEGMIRLARAKAEQAGTNTEFLVADLAHIARHFPEESFDAVLCLGNSLPHLLDQAELVAALRSMRAALKPGGLVVTQALNYDRRWRTQPRFFAPQGGLLDGQEVLVWRFADYYVPAERIAFHIALFRKGTNGWTVQVHTTPQRPLMRGQMVDALTVAGFQDIRSYGAMTWPAPAFDPENSGDLIMVAARG